MTKTLTVSDLPWRPLSEAKDGVYYLLRGPSGYMGNPPHRYVVAKRDPKFRPLQPWVTPGCDSVLDDGPMPTEFAPL